MTYDKREKELRVTWKGVTGFVPSTNVAMYVPGEAADRKVMQTAHPMVGNLSTSAQVGTPMSHVHAGPGHGKTGQKK